MEFAPTPVPAPRTFHVPGKACHRPETLILSGALTTRLGRSVLNERCGTAERYGQYSVRDNMSSAGNTQYGTPQEAQGNTGMQGSTSGDPSPRGKTGHRSCDGFVRAEPFRQDWGSIRQCTELSKTPLRRFKGRPAAFSSVTGLPHQDWGGRIAGFLSGCPRLTPPPGRRKLPAAWQVGWQPAAHPAGRCSSRWRHRAGRRDRTPSPPGERSR